MSLSNYWSISHRLGAMQWRNFRFRAPPQNVVAGPPPKKNLGHLPPCIHSPFTLSAHLLSLLSTHSYILPLFLSPDVPVPFCDNRGQGVSTGENVKKLQTRAIEFWRIPDTHKINSDSPGFVPDKLILRQYIGHRE